MIHALKTVNPYFNDVVAGFKKFEVRCNDRKFKSGDTLILQEYEPKNGYTGNIQVVNVVLIITGNQLGVDKNGVHGIHPDYCVMAIEKTEDL